MISVTYAAWASLRGTLVEKSLNVYGSTWVSAFLPSIVLLVVYCACGNESSYTSSVNPAVPSSASKPLSTPEALKSSTMPRSWSCPVPVKVRLLYIVLPCRLRYSSGFKKLPPNPKPFSPKYFWFSSSVCNCFFILLYSSSRTSHLSRSSSLSTLALSTWSLSFLLTFFCFYSSFSRAAYSISIYSFRVYSSLSFLSSRLSYLTSSSTSSCFRPSWCSRSLCSSRETKSFPCERSF